MNFLHRDMKKGNVRNAPQATPPTKSLNSKHTSVKDLANVNTRLNISTYKTNKFTSRSSNFLPEERQRLRALSLQELANQEAGPLRRQLSFNQSVSFNVDKPSVARSLTLDSSAKPGSGYQSFSSNLVRQINAKKEIQEYKEKKKLDASIRRWNRKVDKTLEDPENKIKSTEDEEHEEQIPYEKAPDISSLTMHGSSSHMKLFNKTFANVHTSRYDPEKEKELAQLVKSRLKNGYTVSQMVLEPVFENVLDVCCDKSYFSSADKVNAELSLDDWRALTKCKYLRVSQRNITSLKEATLEALKDN